MNAQKLQQKATRLERILQRESSTNREAAQLLAALEPLFQQVSRGLITKPLDWEHVPGAHYFFEGNLRNIDGLEEAYAAFQIEVTGETDNEALNWLRSAGSDTID